MSLTRLSPTLTVLLLAGFLFGFAPDGSGFKDKSKEIVVSGTVIDVEVPEFGWPMEFQSLSG